MKKILGWAVSLAVAALLVMVFLSCAAGTLALLVPCLMLGVVAVVLEGLQLAFTWMSKRCGGAAEIGLYACVWSAAEASSAAVGDGCTVEYGERSETSGLRPCVVIGDRDEDAPSSVYYTGMRNEAGDVHPPPPVPEAEVIDPSKPSRRASRPADVVAA